MTAAFYHRFAGSVGNIAGLSFHLNRGLAGLPAFRAEVNRLTGGRAQFELGSDDATAAAAAERGTSLQALALLLFGIIVALAMLVIVGQSIARLAYGGVGGLPRAPRARLQPGAAVRGGAGPRGPGRGGRDGPGRPGGLRAVRVHADRAWPGGPRSPPGSSFDVPVLLGGAALARAAADRPGPP